MGAQPACSLPAFKPKGGRKGACSAFQHPPPEFPELAPPQVQGGLLKPGLSLAVQAHSAGRKAGSMERLGLGKG